MAELSVGGVGGGESSYLQAYSPGWTIHADLLVQEIILERAISAE
jgi:hypothetical protein